MTFTDKEAGFAYQCDVKHGWEAQSYWLGNQSRD